MIQNCKFSPCEIYSDVKLAGTRRLQIKTLGIFKNFASYSHFLKTLSKSQVNNVCFSLISEEHHELKSCGCPNRGPILNF